MGLRETNVQNMLPISTQVKVIPFFKKNKPRSTALTQLCGGLHQAPGLASPLADDKIQHVGLQAVLQHLVQRRAQVLQDEVTHVGTHPAVPQLGLEEFGGAEGSEKCLKENVKRTNTELIQNDFAGHVEKQTSNAGLLFYNLQQQFFVLNSLYVM